jgi:hypothetical protein
MKSKKFSSWFFMRLFMLGGTRINFPQTNFWQQTNGPYGGDLNVLVINSRGYDFAGTLGRWEDRGIFCSTDNGETWSQINTGLTVLGVMSLAIYSNG